MTIDERIEALTMNLELLSHQQEAQAKQQEAQARRIEMLITAAEKDGENIRSLALIAESHERRLTELEDGSSTP